MRFGLLAHTPTCRVYLSSPDGAMLVREMSFDVQPGRRCGKGSSEGASLPQHAPPHLRYMVPLLCYSNISQQLLPLSNASPQLKCLGLKLSLSPPTLPAPQRAHHGPQRQRQVEPAARGGRAVAPAGERALGWHLNQCNAGQCACSSRLLPAWLWPHAPPSQLPTIRALICVPLLLQAGEVTLPPKGELFYLSQRPCEYGGSWAASRLGGRSKEG